MYYHYFKVIAESDTFAQGLNKIMNDELSEYPKTLNACSKYTLMPEVSRVHFEKKPKTTISPLSPQVSIGFLYHCGKSLNLFYPQECSQV